MISPFSQAWLGNFPAALIMRVKQWFDDLCRQVNAALTSIASMPAISTQNVVTGARAFGVAYHNTNARPMFVSVSAYYSIAQMNLTALTDTMSTPTSVVQAINSPFSLAGSIGFWVLPGNYYKVTSNADNLIYWTEWV